MAATTSALQMCENLNICKVTVVLGAVVCSAPACDFKGAKWTCLPHFSQWETFRNRWH